MKALRRLAAFLGALSLFCAHTATNAQTAGAITARCGELPADSFPPNQLLPSEEGGGRVFSVLQSSEVGAWSKFFLRVDLPGTYRVDVDLRKGPGEAVFQLFVDRDPIGQPVDCYVAGGFTPVGTSIGDVTFLKPGNYPFRFLVTGRNPASSGFSLALEKITLTPVAGFTLLSPNGSCEEGADVLLRWNSWPATKQYQIEMDGRAAGMVDAPATSYQVAQLARGSHRWRIVAIDSSGKQMPSDVFSFVVGSPPPYPGREFTETFGSGNLGEWFLESMDFVSDSTGGHLQAKGAGIAILPDVRLDKTEGEIATHFTPGSADAAAGVGFQSDDGTRVYAVADLPRQQLRIERSIGGPARYSIFEVTPKPYQVLGWAEREAGDRTIWEIAAKPILVHPGVSCELKLAYSRRSGCVMATLIPADGSPVVTLRDLTDLRTPDHPLLLTLSGAAAFADASLHLLNRSVYKWDPDTTRIVLRPGPPGAWDEKGAFNPAIVVRNGIWHMVYRGNSKPAPPNGPISSELGLATSTDGVHWIKSLANPIFSKEAPDDSVEDPDLIWPKGSDQVYLEYHSFHVAVAQPTAIDSVGKPGKWPHGEVMRSSADLVHWSDPWVLNIGKTFGKNGGFIDTQDAGIAAVQCDDTAYRYLTMIEEGRIDLSNDLHQWIKAGTADLKGSPNRWCNSHECSGDIFVDADKNIRFESQIGVNPETGHGGAVVGNRLCTVGEGVLSGSDPTKVLWRSDLPWLTDWYGDAPTGAPEDFTATNGSVFPGQTIIRDGWLRHYSGGNNHFVLLTECWYGSLIECRNLQVAMDAAGQCSVSVTARNIGSLNGSGQIVLSVDGRPNASQQVTLNRDTETTLRWTVSVPAGMHTLAVDDLSATVKPGAAGHATAITR